MKHFMTTTAAALVLSTAAYANETMATFQDTEFDAETHLNASEFIGMRVYASEAQIEGTVAEGGETEWDDIGEINELILTREGSLESVIVGVGGFLGMGEKDVAMGMDQIKFVAEEGESGEFFLVVNANAAGVEEAPEYERVSTSGGWSDNADATDESAEMNKTDDAAEMEADTATETADAGTSAETENADAEMAKAPSVEREGYTTVDAADLTADDLTGARVYSTNDEDIGEIGTLLLTDDGKMDRAVLDVGGFLGIGEKDVAVQFDELQIIRSEDGAVRVYIDSTQEALEAKPEYQG
ncbi:PRC-barrel domain-containing protein [Cognatishimia sp. MH4019]|uniref:PRC-barrel domain-containing protein n=1 Tax=Cognatishimia sp. MH4019 TaxID=2854030 RepID=UPI001CD4E9CB|nr:PRC-barrel domain-containing protein [Cognatishimia sp. MH4019]